MSIEGIKEWGKKQWKKILKNMWMWVKTIFKWMKKVIADGAPKLFNILIAPIVYFGILFVFYIAVKSYILRQNWLSTFGVEAVKAWGPVLIGIAGIIGGIIANLFLLNSQRKQNERQNENTLKQINQLKTKEEKDEIIEKLNIFYGPFKELRRQSLLLYEKFALETRNEYRSRGERFRTLNHILNGNHFTGQDAEILGQILEINKKILHLIETNTGVVDKVELQDLLGKFAAHIRILQMACDGAIIGHSKIYEDIVFPLEVDGAIESAILRLKYRLQEIGTLEGSKKDEKIKLSKEEEESIRYYDLNVDEYADCTGNSNLIELYKIFLENIKMGGRILDAGCGVGRDVRNFIMSGYRVVAFDASNAMVQKCCDYPHAYCIKNTFNGIDYKEEFDGVWACASLLHTEPKKAKKDLRQLVTALKPKGYLFISLKKGSGHLFENGKHFYLYDESTIQELCGDKRLDILKIWTTPDNLSIEKRLDWINILLKRKEYFII